MSRKNVKWLILGICAAALAGWVALMVIIFRDKEPEEPKDKPDVTEQVAGSATVSATPGAQAVIMLKTVVSYTYDNGKKADSSIRYEYDELGRRVKRTTYTGDMPEYVTEYVYEEDTHYTKVIDHSKTPGMETWSWYDPSGVMRKKIWLDANSAGEQVLIAWKESDEKGRQTLYSWYATDGSGELSRIETTYDAYDHKMSEKEISYDGDGDGVPDGAMIEKVQVRSVCDDQGRVICQYVPEYPNYTGEDKWCISFAVEYHDDGSRTETLYEAAEDYNGKSDSLEGAVAYDVTVTVEYNAEGFEMSRTRKGKDARGNDSEVRTEYTRDEQGRAITELMYVNGEPANKTESTYTLEGKRYTEKSTYTSASAKALNDIAESVGTRTVDLHGNSRYEDSRFDRYEEHVVTKFVSGQIFYESIVSKDFRYDSFGNCVNVRHNYLYNGEQIEGYSCLIDYQALNLSGEQMCLRKEFYYPMDTEEEGTGRP